MSCAIIHSPKFIQIDTNHMVMFALWSFSCFTTKKLVTLNYIQYKDKRCKSCWLLFYFNGLFSFMPQSFRISCCVWCTLLMKFKIQGYIQVVVVLFSNLHQKTKEKVVPCCEKKKGLSLRKKSWEAKTLVPLLGAK